MKVLVSPMLPIPPSPGELGRRIVRHGLADVLEWLGEEPGPKPGDQTHAVAGVDLAADAGLGVLMVSQEFYDELAAMPRGKTVSWDIPGLFGRPS